MPISAPTSTGLIKAFQWDLARQVERLDVLLEQLPKYAAWGYTELYLHLEDAMEYPSFPSIAREDAYRYREIEQLVRAAQRVGIGVVPTVNLLGHTQYLIKTPELRDLNELREPDGSALFQGQICPLHPRTEDVARRLIGDIAPFCTAGKVHAGLDESFSLGRCPRCRAEIAQHGLAYHFSHYVQRLHAIAAQKNLRLGMWADMLYFVPEAIPDLPTNLIAYDWYYYPFRRHPRVEFFNFAERDLRAPLRRRGIEYWACPMNGAFRYEPMPIFKDRLDNIRAWWKRAQRETAGLLITSWESYRLAFAVPSVVDAAAASLWLEDKGERLGNRELLQRGAARCFGSQQARKIADLLLKADMYPFSGYARWEENDRWTGLAGTKSRRETRGAVQALRVLARAAEELPAAAHASLEFRCYLEERRAFIARAGDGVCDLRKALTKKPGLDFESVRRLLEQECVKFRKSWTRGFKAAKAMWKLSRDPHRTGQNEIILRRDAQRLRTWQNWLRSIRRSREKVWEENPVFGAWQLVIEIENFAPAVQRVAIETRHGTGNWEELVGRYTIEFQSKAAQPRTKIRRKLSIPCPAPNASQFRISLRGVGQVRIKFARLTDGVKTLRAKQKNFLLGLPAPKSRLPDPGANTDARDLKFI